MNKIKKNLENKLYFFPTFQKITVGGFANQLIKKFWPNEGAEMYTSTIWALMRENLSWVGPGVANNKDADQPAHFYRYINFPAIPVDFA